MADMIGSYYAAFLEYRFTGPQAALSVLEIDQRQKSSILFGRFLYVVDVVRCDQRFQQVRQQGAWHSPGGTRVEVCHQRDRFLPVERSFDGIAASRN